MIIVGSYIVYTDLIIHTKLSLVVMDIVTAQTGSMLLSRYGSLIVAMSDILVSRFLSAAVSLAFFPLNCMYNYTERASSMS